MNQQAVNSLFEELIKRYEDAETQCILFVNTNKTRDFKILADRVKRFKLRLKVIQDGGSDDIGEAGTSAGEGNIPG
jgi:hypothetical protein